MMIVMHYTHVLVHLPKPQSKHSSFSLFETAINIQSQFGVQELGADPDIYEKLTASIAPSIWQLDDVKKGILCQLFGGCTKVLNSAYQTAQTHEHRRMSTLSASCSSKLCTKKYTECVPKADLPHCLCRNGQVGV